MKVILRKEVPKLGEEDSVLEVSGGYARNYLIPKKMAVLATPKEISAAQKRKQEKEKQLEAKRAEFEELANRLSSLEIAIPTDAGEGGKLFGSVTAGDIALAVQSMAQVEVDKKKIELNEPIRVLGEYEVPLKIYKEIGAKLKVKVVAK